MTKGRTTKGRMTKGRMTKGRTIKRQNDQKVETIKRQKKGRKQSKGRIEN